MGTSAQKRAGGGNRNRSFQPGCRFFKETSIVLRAVCGGRSVCGMRFAQRVRVGVGGGEWVGGDLRLLRMELVDCAQAHAKAPNSAADSSRARTLLCLPCSVLGRLRLFDICVDGVRMLRLHDRLVRAVVSAMHGSAVSEGGA